MRAHLGAVPIAPRRQIYISIGGNIGDVAETMREAVRRIWRIPGTQLLLLSSFYETAPWGNVDQPPFLNAVLKVATSLSALEFLHHTQRIERELGRVRHEHWGARTIDIDLLYVVEPPQVRGGLGLAAVADGEPLVVDTAELTLPHPYLAERAFVLVPWREIAPRLRVGGRSIAEMAAAPEVKEQGIKRTMHVNAPYPFRMIACVDEEWGIGRGGELLVHLAEDMTLFREKTECSLVIMGRKTADSLPGRRPLPERRNLILTHAPGDFDPHFDVAYSVADIYAIAKNEREDFGPIPMWVIGGGEVYRELLPYAEEVHLTHVPGTHGADTFFPHEGLADFDQVGEQAGKDCKFVVYSRRH